MKRILAAITGRCATHDRASYAVTARLEQALGMPVSPPPKSFTERFANPDLIDCGNRRCRKRRQ